MTNKHAAWLCLALLFGLSGIVATGQSSPADARAHRLAVILKQNGPDGLHEAAKLNGGKLYLSQTWLHHIRFTTLESLAKNADLGVIGTPVSSEVKLIHDGRDIVTEYKVKVLEPIQGKAQWDGILNISLLGGKITFDDGTTAEIFVSDLPRLQIGHRYVLYLEDIKERPITYQPLCGPEGVFELGTDGKVVPFATPEATQAAANGDDALEFVDKVRFASRLQKPQ